MFFKVLHNKKEILISCFYAESQNILNVSFSEGPKHLLAEK